MRRAALDHTSFPASDFSGADLSEGNLRAANLCGANLRGTSLNAATLADTNLSAAILEFAELTHALLHRTNLTGTDLREACFGQTVIADCPTLALAAALETISHLAPSSIDLTTLARIHGELPAAFLDGIGAGAILRPDLPG